MPKPKTQSQTVFVLDDDPVLLREMRIYLEDRGHRVLTASDSTTGERVLNDSGWVDRAFIDKGAVGGFMSHRSGLEVATMAKQKGAVVFIDTGEDHVSREVVESGADFFVGKPFGAKGLDWMLTAKTESDIQDAPCYAEYLPSQRARR